MRLPAIVSGAIDAAPLVPRDMVRLGSQKYNILADLGKEVQLVWTGVAVSSKFLNDSPQLVEGFLRGAVKGREFSRRYRDETIATISKHDPSPLEGIKLDYDVTKASMTETGRVADDVLREEVAIRAELTKAANPPSPSLMYDYTIVKKIYDQLKSSGWQPKGCASMPPRQSCNEGAAINWSHPLVRLRCFGAEQQEVTCCCVQFAGPSLRSGLSS